VSGLTGLVVMIATVSLVFVLARGLVGTWWAFAGAAVLLVLWWRFNMREASTGLIRANLKTYFALRHRGAPHTEALIRVVQSRFPLSRERQARVLSRLADLVEATPDEPDTAESRGANDGLETRLLVYLVYCEENGEPPEGVRGEIMREIDLTIRALATGREPRAQG
jgi:hypothetical protein